MCGIAGIVQFNSVKVEREALERMSSYLQERGPDYTGFFIDDKVGLLHTRLSIIDLDERSHQPMHIEDKEISISFNGEIYNFLDLKEELKAQGCTFRTESDTEVLLLGYKVWGIDVLLTKVRGMFAFALSDRGKGLFYLVRDFFGKKPLYYFYQNQELYFSSDIRSIWGEKASVLNIDFNSIDYYLTELSMPQPNTIWKEVKQVPHAHYLCFNLDQGGLSVKRYWTLGERKESKVSFQEAIEETERQLSIAVGRRMLADVPIGSFLSGGVDSGLVVAFMARQSSLPINTYSVGLSYEKMNELPDAKKVADRYQTNHYEIVLEADILQDLPRLIEYNGEPFADSSMLPSFYITREMASNFRVALSGDGGDELFGGYKDYGIAYRSEAFLSQYPNTSYRKWSTLVNKVMSRVRGGGENYGSYQHYLTLSPAKRLYRHMGFSFEAKSALYKRDSELNQCSDFSLEYLNKLWQDESKSKGLTDHLLRTSLNTRLLNDYLVKVDRTSMLNSLEVRSPFLDIDLAEWAFSLPNEYKFKGSINKYILKKIAEKHLASDIITRPKRGFSIPVAKWLQNEMYDWMVTILLDSQAKIGEFLNRNYIEQLVKEHRIKGNHEHRLWALICLELWFQRFVPK